MTRYSGKDWYPVTGNENIWGFDHDGDHHIFFRVVRIKADPSDPEYGHRECWGWYHYGIFSYTDYTVYGLFESRMRAQEAAELYFHTHVERGDE